MKNTIQFWKRLDKQQNYLQVFHDTERTLQKWNAIFVHCNGFTKNENKRIDIFDGTAYFCSIQTGACFTLWNEREL